MDNFSEKLFTIVDEYINVSLPIRKNKMDQISKYFKDKNINLLQSNQFFCVEGELINNDEVKITYTLENGKKYVGIFDFINNNLKTY